MKKFYVYDNPTNNVYDTFEKRPSKALKTSDGCSYFRFLEESEERIEEFLEDWNAFEQNVSIKGYMRRFLNRRYPDYTHEKDYPVTTMQTYKMFEEYVDFLGGFNVDEADGYIVKGSSYQYVVLQDNGYAYLDWCEGFEEVDYCQTYAGKDYYYYRNDLTIIETEFTAEEEFQEDDYTVKTYKILKCSRAEISKHYKHLQVRTPSNRKEKLVSRLI